MIICLYVGDMLSFGTNIEVVSETKTFLSSQFEIKDLDEANVILAIKLKKKKTKKWLLPKSISLHQKILKRFDFYTVVPMKIRYDPRIYLKKNKGPSVTQDRFVKIM